MSKLMNYWWAVLLTSTFAFVALTLNSEIVELRITKALSDLQVIDAAIRQYAKQTKQYPSTTEGLALLVGHPAGIKFLGLDPWDNPYVYTFDSATQRFQLYSRGRDGFDNGGDGDDITNRSKKYRCEDYGVNCPPTFEDMSKYFLLTLMMLSLLIGLGKLFLLATTFIRRTNT